MLVTKDQTIPVAIYIDQLVQMNLLNTERGALMAGRDGKVEIGRLCNILNKKMLKN